MLTALCWYDLALITFALLLRILILVKPSRFRLNFLTQIKFMVFTNSCCLIFKSKGESQAREGDRLTSKSHGLRLESIITSKPSNSKQLFLQGIFLSYFWTYPSTEIMLLIMRSYILLHSKSLSMPICSKCLHKAVKLHLCPSSPWSAFVF